MDKEGGNEGERLQKVLARLGVASRRGVEAMIREGRVTVNGSRAELGLRVVEGDRVEVDGQPVVGESRIVTLMLHKPAGVVTTASDERGRKTVMDLMPDIPGLHPVGRLDMDSEGLLLFTTDGELTLRLTHPRYRHRKNYRVWCPQGELPRAAVEQLMRGIELEDGLARAAHAAARPGGCELVLTEGRKRQVRRMLEAIGFDVARLVRTGIGRLELGDLPLGTWRQLTEADVERALSAGR